MLDLYFVPLFSADFDMISTIDFVDVSNIFHDYLKVPISDFLFD